MKQGFRRFYCSLNIIGIIDSMSKRWAKHVTRMGGKRNARRGLVGKTEGKRRLGRLTLRWEVNIEMDPKEMEWEGVNWIHLADFKNKRWALSNTLMKFAFIKCGEILDRLTKQLISEKGFCFYLLVT